MKPVPGQSDERRIDFIVVGAQKAGTTALFEHLSDHPGIGLSDVKEIHFFDDEAFDWQAGDYGSYHRHFDWHDGRVRGEATPIYAYWPGAMERIKVYHPAIKLIMMLRDPVERAWSHWRMEFGRGVETHDFSWCIRQGRQRLFEASPWGHHREFSYVERGFYGDQLEVVRQLFGPKQLWVIGAQDLQSEPSATLGRVTEFLGVASLEHVQSRAVHVGLEMGEMSATDRDYLHAVYAADQARLAAI